MSVSKKVVKYSGVPIPEITVVRPALSLLELFPYIIDRDQAFS